MTLSFIMTNARGFVLTVLVVTVAGPLSGNEQSQVVDLKKRGIIVETDEFSRPVVLTLRQSAPKLSEAEWDFLFQAGTLTTVSVECDEVSDDFLSRLFSAKTIKYASFHQSGVSDSQLKCISHHQGIESIVLSSKMTGKSLSSLTLIPRLNVIEFDGPGFSDHTIDAIQRLSQLSTVTIGRKCLISIEGLRKVVACPRLKAITVHKPFGDAEFAVIGDCRQLENLAIGEWCVSDAAFERVAQLGKLKRLIAPSGVTDGCANVVRQCAMLRHLDLQYTGITDKGMSDVAELRSLSTLVMPRRVSSSGINVISPLPRLILLQLRESTIDDEMIDAISKMPVLVAVDFVDCDLTAEGLAKLRRRCPSVSFSSNLVPK